MNSVPVNPGDEFEYLGRMMVCIDTKKLLCGVEFDALLAHYFDDSGALLECELPTNVWKAIRKVENGL